MKYFIDTEFIEGFHKPLFGKRRHFIDLISIGIKCEDGREYYAISKEFNYKDADEWVKMNVILPIVQESVNKYNEQAKRLNMGFKDKPRHLDVSAITVVQKFEGKTNAQIASDIVKFIFPSREECKIEDFREYQKLYGGDNLQIWGYYADYDWVVFCSLFGRMIDLSKGFPMYCKDIKQLMYEVGLGVEWKRSHCPDPQGEHNALIDARWNKQLYDKIQQVKQEQESFEKIALNLNRLAIQPCTWLVKTQFGDLMVSKADKTQELFEYYLKSGFVKFPHIYPDEWFATRPQRESEAGPFVSGKELY